MAIAIFSTWTTYGTWLPGDVRSWFQRGHGVQEANSLRELEASLLMTEDAIVLDPEQRGLVESTIRDQCLIRKWELYAVNCRSNHMHVVVAAPGRSIELPREHFKAWCTWKLKELEHTRSSDRFIAVRQNWWTDRGWDEYVDEDVGLTEVVGYVDERQ
jgi:hypothetical protein